MPSPGGGPSRRSHTKSRKGCKTCKRRHIRCDESFPQCRNCTKHQVRCDYMDHPAPGDEALSSSSQADLLWTPDIQHAVELWQTSGHFPFPELQLYPQPQWHTFPTADLRLIYHVSSICSEMLRGRMSKFTIWVDLMPKFLNLAGQYPFVMHAVMAFSATHLAWVTQSSETRQIASSHGAIAMRDLHEAIGAFSRDNADAIIAASLLLSWQSTDWRGWSSLMTGVKTISSTMQGHLTRDSPLSGVYTQHADWPQYSFTDSPSLYNHGSRQEHMTILHNVSAALARLQTHLTAHEQEFRWIDQLSGYLERLRTSNSPANAEEQFSQLYALRKWLFWMPVTLLSDRKGDLYTILFLSYFYATALALEPLFPNIGMPFITHLAVSPLEELSQIVGSFDSSSQYNPQSQMGTMLMEWPRTMLSVYQTRRNWTHTQRVNTMTSQVYGIDMLNVDLGHHIQEFGFNQSLSPAFVPSPLHMTPPAILPGQGPSSPYLEVPRSGVDYVSYSNSGSNFSTPVASPIMISPLPSMYKQEEATISGIHVPYGYTTNAGFVIPPATSIWT